MSANTSIEWTEKTWHAKSAAKRIGIPVEEYLRLRADGQKHCWQCRSWKPCASFGIDRSRGDGRASRCSSCAKPPKQLRLIRPTATEIERLRYATDADYRHRRRQRVHARKRGLEPLPIEGAESLLDWTGGLCTYCDSPATAFDHIVPVAAGGRTVPGNMAPACVSCNSKKKDRNVFDFIDRFGIQVTTRLDGILALALEKGILNEHIHVD